jgi:hypothetical protein
MPGAAGVRIAGPLAVAGGALLVVGFFLGLIENDRLSHFLHTYLVSVSWAASISLGALFFVAVQHATRAGWGVVVRRIAELWAINIVTVALLFLPVLISVAVRNHSLYEWLDQARTAVGGSKYSELIGHKQAYLNHVFFVIRSIGYFVAWWCVARFFFTRSLRQDETGDPQLTVQMERWSGPSLILFAITLTLAAFDWLMSLAPEWYSTIFGLYFFAGSVVSSLSTIVVTAAYLQATGRIQATITPEHYHDLGKLMLGFVIFWGYMAFSQYMLIWYGNIPEETTWYLARQTNGWAFISLALLAGNLLIPFFGLLSREVKRRRRVLGIWGIWLLVFHWLDMYWLVMPSRHEQPPTFGLTDFTVAAGIGCLFLAGMLRVASRTSWVPLKDPRLAESLAFENY